VQQLERTYFESRVEVGVSDFELVVKAGEANLSSFHKLLVKFSNKKEINESML